LAPPTADDTRLGAVGTACREGGEVPPLEVTIKDVRRLRNHPHHTRKEECTSSNCTPRFLDSDHIGVGQMTLAMLAAPAVAPVAAAVGTMALAAAAAVMVVAGWRLPDGSCR
jgi:hypothetical protein